MTESPLATKLVKAGILLLDTVNASVLKIIPLQYNPETLSRSLQMRGGGSEGGSQGDARRLSAAPVESYTVEAVWDATDKVTTQISGNSEIEHVLGDLSVLETILYPESKAMQDNQELAGLGSWNIIPVQKPLTVFSWGNNRVMPVRITSFSVTEEAFDTSLNPTRARISLGMQVLTIEELGYNSVGGTLYMAYQKQKEGLAGAWKSGGLDALDLQSNGIMSGFL